MQLFINLYNFIIRLLSGLIWDKFIRKDFRAQYSILKKGYTNSPFVKSKLYKKIYYPIYSKSAVQDSTEPKLFNKNGELLTPVFYRGAAGAMMSSAINGQYIYSDRFNFGLPTHIYADLSMLEKIGNPTKCYGMFSEPKTISPMPYTIFDKNKGLDKDFDLIFTHSEDILEKYDNARPFCFFSMVWHRLSDQDGNLPSNWLEYKRKNISIVSSDKIMCNLHKFRLELARKCKRDNLADSYGTFDGGMYVEPADYLDNYRYSIVVENDIEPYWFTEKILNCFATMTIPIYIGASKINEFFNEDGIIRINEKDFDNIENILKQCTKEAYDDRIDIIKENYEKSKVFDNNWDFLYKKYLKEDLKK